MLRATRKGPGEPWKLKELLDSDEMMAAEMERCGREYLDPTRPITPRTPEEAQESRERIQRRARR